MLIFGILNLKTIFEQIKHFEVFDHNFQRKNLIDQFKSTYTIILPKHAKKHI